MNLTMTSFVKGSLLAAGLLISGLAPSYPSMSALAFDRASTRSVNLDKSGVAIRGFDPVAYFTDARPTKGNSQISATYQSATFYFASTKNRELFLKEPEKFVPAFGGFCAIGAALGGKFDGDPNLWKIVEGKLYLNKDVPAQRSWLKDVSGNITKANRNWSKIKDRAPKDL